MRIPLLLLTCLFCSQLYAQRLENIRAEAVNGGEQVTITYDLVGSSPDQKYKVAVYSSHNNYTTSLTQVSGDLNDVKPGNGKRIVWNAKGEMVEYSGNITFELRADPIAVPLTVKTPGTVKKGKTVTINYSGVAPGESAKLELVKAGVVVNTIGTSTDPGKYTWAVPLDVAKSSDYQIRVTSGARTANSGTFPVKSKPKAIVYIIPAAVIVAVVVVVLATKGGKDKGGNGTTATDLPEAPTGPK